MEDSDSSFGITIFSKNYNNFFNKFDLSKIKAQGDTIIIINPLASPSAGAPALNYGDANTETTSPGEVKGLTHSYF